MVQTRLRCSQEDNMVADTNDADTPRSKPYGNWHELVRRGLFMAMGFSQTAHDRPWIAVANTWNELNPGHCHLRGVAEAVKRGILQAGGTPVEFNTESICDGMSHKKSFHLPVRELIAFSTAHLLKAHQVAGCVFISGCDKNVPGQLMAAAEADLPSILVTGGSMLPGTFRGEDIVCCTDGRRLFGEYERGDISDEEFRVLLDNTHPGVGACGTMGTANTMQALAEALGLCLPGSASVPAVAARRLWLAEASGRQIMDLVAQKITARAILTEKALDNAIRVLMAIGGSTNGILHLTAIARKAGVPLDIERFATLSDETPFLCDVKPSGRHTVLDFDKAGGVLQVQRELADLLHLDALTVTGKTLGDNLREAPLVQSGPAIRQRTAPLSPDGGIVVLRGNVCPGGAIIKKSGVERHLYTHTGPARVFESYAAFETMMHSGTVDFTADHVLVIRNEGPRGAPGMPEILIPPNLYRHGLEHCVMLTDGRTSGTQRGRLVVHMSPEAAAQGPLALVRNDDVIRLDITARTLDVLLPEAELAARQAALAAQPGLARPEGESQWLRMYRANATSAMEGAGMLVD